MVKETGKPIEVRLLPRCSHRLTRVEGTWKALEVAHPEHYLAASTVVRFLSRPEPRFAQSDITIIDHLPWVKFFALCGSEFWNVQRC